MKNTIIILLLAGLVSCTGNSLISEIESDCKIKTKAETLGDGTEYYEYYLFKLNFVKIENKAKGIIDRRLDQVGRQTDNHKTDYVFKTTKNTYEWETPKIKVTMSVIWGGNSDAHLKIWIMNK